MYLIYIALAYLIIYKTISIPCILDFICYNASVSSYSPHIAFLNVSVITYSYSMIKRVIDPNRNIVAAVVYIRLFNSIPIVYIFSPTDSVFI